MKRIASIILTICILCSVFVAGTASANAADGSRYTVYLKDSYSTTKYTWFAWTWNDGESGFWVSGTEVGDTVEFYGVCSNVTFSRTPYGTASGTWSDAYSNDLIVEGSTYVVTGLSNYRFNGYWEGSPISTLTTYNGFTGDCSWSLNANTGVLKIEGSGKTDDYGTMTGNQPWHDYKNLIKKINVLEGVTQIGLGLLTDTPNLTEVSIPSSVTEIAYCLGHYCPSMKNFSVSKDNTEYSSLDGNLYSKNQDTLYCYAAGKTDTSFSLPNTVTAIDSCAIRQANNLKKIYINKELTTTKGNSIRECKNLQNIYVDEENAVFSSHNGDLYSKSGRILYFAAIGKSADEFSIFEGATTIYNYAFYECKNITSIFIPESVSKINKNAFEGCSELKSINIPDGVISIGEYAFYGCSKLESINIPNGIETIEKSTFYDCESLKTLIIPDSVTSIGNYAFWNCSGLTDILVNKSLESVGYASFYNCSAITDVYYKGSQSDWNGITFDSYNEPIKNATKHYNYSAAGFPTDTTKPTGNISSTNNLSSSQTVTLTFSDNKGIKGYYWGTSSVYSANTYTSTSLTSATKTVSSAGTYYLTVKDTSDNLSSTYSITFYYTTLNANGGTISGVSNILTKSGSSFTPNTPTRNNYSFAGWNTSSTAATGVKTITPSSSTTYYAIWTRDDASNPTGSISATNNLSSSQTVTLTFSDNKGIKGYYWGTSSSYSSNTYTSTSSTSATKTVNSAGTYYLTVKDTSDNLSSTYSITFYYTTLNANGGTISGASNILTKSGSSFTPNTPTKSDYTFTGWNTNAYAVTGSTTIKPSSSTTYYAVWTKTPDTTKPTGSISSTNNLSSSQTVTLYFYDNKGVAGYYWGTSSSYSSNTYTSASSSSATKTVSSAGTYYLTVKDTSGNVSQTYSVTFYKTDLSANGGTLSGASTILTPSGKSITPNAPSRSGYTFIGWGTSATSTTGVKTITPTSSTSYYAVWKSFSKPTISVDFTDSPAKTRELGLVMEAQGGIKTYTYTRTGDSPTTINVFSSPSFLSSETVKVTKPGHYTFTVTDAYGNQSDAVSVDVYQEKFDAAGGSVSPASLIMSQDEYFNDSDYLPTPTRSGYNFQGWEWDGNYIYVNNSQYGVKYTAKWKYIPKAQTISSDDSYSYYFSKKSFNIKAKAKTTLTFTSNNTSIVTVSNSGKVKIKGVGSTTIKIKAKATSKYKSASTKVKVKIWLDEPLYIKKTQLTNSYGQPSKNFKIQYKGVKGADGYEIRVNKKITKAEYKAEVKKGSKNVFIFFRYNDEKRIYVKRISVNRSKSPTITVTLPSTNSFWYIEGFAYKKMNGKRVYSDYKENYTDFGFYY